VVRCGGHCVAVALGGQCVGIVGQVVGEGAVVHSVGEAVAGQIVFTGVHVVGRGGHFVSLATQSVSTTLHVVGLGGHFVGVVAQTVSMITQVVNCGGHCVGVVLGGHRVGIAGHLLRLIGQCVSGAPAVGQNVGTTTVVVCVCAPAGTIHTPTSKPTTARLHKTRPMALLLVRSQERTLHMQRHRIREQGPEPFPP